ncbi:MAG: hypothetical protein M1530_01800 [Candidatus Marsarchaeota archaeon]|nr:hypothetical protein [Candidatus Marsarchaeota archaeon]
MKLVKGKQDNPDRQSGGYEGGRPIRFNNTIYPFLHKIMDGMKLGGVGTVMIFQTFGNPGYRQPSHQDSAYGNMSQYLPSKTYGASVQQVFNPQTREYETHMKVQQADMFSEVAKFIFSQFEGVVKFHGDTWAGLLGFAAAGTAYSLLGRLKAFKKEGAGGTFIFRGDVKEQLEAVKRYVVEQNYGTLRDEIVKSRTEARMTELQNKASAILEKNQFGAGDFVDFDKLSYEQIKLVVEERLRRIGRQVSVLDPTFSTKVSVDATEILAPLGSKRAPSAIVESAPSSPSAMTASLLAGRLNNYVESIVEEYLHNAKEKILAAEHEAVKMTSITPTAEAAGTSFARYVQEKMNAAKVGRGQTFTLEGKELGEVISKTLYDMIPRAERGGLTQADFIKNAEAQAAEMGSLELTRPGKARGVLGRIFSTGGARVALGLMVGAAVWYGANWLFIPSPETGSKTVTLQNPPQPEGTAIQSSDSLYYEKKDYRRYTPGFFVLHTTAQFINSMGKRDFRVVYNAKTDRTNQIFGLQSVNPGALNHEQQTGMPMVGMDKARKTFVYGQFQDLPTGGYKEGHRYQFTITIDSDAKLWGFQIFDLTENKEQSSKYSLPLPASWDIVKTSSDNFRIYDCALPR